MKQATVSPLRAGSNPYREAPPPAPPPPRDWAKLVKPTMMVVLVGVVCAVTFQFLEWAGTEGEIPVQIEHREDGKPDVVRVRVYKFLEHEQYATCSARLLERHQQRCREVGWRP